MLQHNIWCTTKCNISFASCLFLKKSRGRYKYKKKTYDMHITILHIQKTFNLYKQTFCNTALKFQTPRRVSYDNQQSLKKIYTVTRKFL